MPEVPAVVTFTSQLMACKLQLLLQLYFRAAVEDCFSILICLQFKWPLEVSQ